MTRVITWFVVTALWLSGAGITSSSALGCGHRRGRRMDTCEHYMGALGTGYWVSYLWMITGDLVEQNHFLVSVWSEQNGCDTILIGMYPFARYARYSPTDAEHIRDVFIINRTGGMRVCVNNSLFFAWCEIGFTNLVILNGKFLLYIKLVDCYQVCPIRFPVRYWQTLANIGFNDHHMWYMNMFKKELESCTSLQL